MSIEPHASPTVEAVASLQKEAERVKPGNHVEQVKTESETLETVAAFGGLPMGDLIARPVLEASKAQQALAEGYLTVHLGSPWNAALTFKKKSGRLPPRKKSSAHSKFQADSSY